MSSVSDISSTASSSSEVSDSESFSGDVINRHAIFPFDESLEPLATEQEYDAHREGTRIEEERDEELRRRFTREVDLESW